MDQETLRQIRAELSKIKKHKEARTALELLDRAFPGKPAAPKPKPAPAPKPDFEEAAGGDSDASVEAGW